MPVEAVRALPIVLLVTVLSSCRSVDTEQPAPREDSSNRPGIGRYQMVAGNAGIFKLDTATGSTWIFDSQSGSWKASPDAPSSDAGVEARIRTVVERAVTPLIPDSVYNTKTQHLDKVSEAEKQRRIREIVQQALTTYDADDKK